MIHSHEKDNYQTYGIIFLLREKCLLIILLLDISENQIAVECDFTYKIIEMNITQYKRVNNKFCDDDLHILEIMFDNKCTLYARKRNFVYNISQMFS